MGSSAKSAFLACAAILLLVSSATSSPGWDDSRPVPLPQDLVDGYRQNYEAFSTLRVQWRREVRKTDAWFECRRAQAALYEREAGSGDYAQAQRDSFRDRAKSMALEAADPRTPRTERFYYEYWTDRARFQMRKAPPAAEKAENGWTFPDDPLTPETLTTVYKDYYILSFAPGEAEGYRGWAGRRHGKFHVGMVFTKNPDSDIFQFPPLGVRNGLWGSHWHPYDTFLSQPVDKMKVTGSVTFNGRRCYLLEYATPLEDLGKRYVREFAQQYQGRLKIVDVTRAWVDPAQGFLPLRLEWSQYRYLDGKLVYGPPPLKPMPNEPAVETKLVQRVEGAGYYPMKTEEYTYRPVPAAIGDGKFTERLLGVEPPPPVCMIKVCVCQAMKVQGTAKPNPGLFAMAFPEGTSYFDDTKGKGFITGSVQQFVDGLVDASTNLPDPRPYSRSSWLWWVVGVNAAVIATLSLGYGYRKRRMRRLA